MIESGVHDVLEVVQTLLIIWILAYVTLTKD